LIATLGFFGSYAWEGPFFASVIVLFIAAAPAGDTLAVPIAVLTGTLLAVAWLSVPVWSIVVAARRFRARAWGAAMIAACFPVLALLLVLEGFYWSDLLRFTLERPNLVAALEAARAGRPSPVPRVQIAVGPPTIAFFTWQGFLSSAHGVVYDETDEIAKPAETRSSAWRERLPTHELDCPGDVRRLSGHFYAARLIC
jgi:hypothetical protein